MFVPRPDPSAHSASVQRMPKVQVVVYRRWTIVQLNSQNSHVHQLLLRLGKRIRSLRKERGWSQEEFAHRSGLNRSYMSDIEGGKSDISISRLLKVARGFGITISELFSDVG